MDEARAALRIGELSRRTGVAVPTLRAWERRYGLLAPSRTDGGHRLYGDADVERVRAMQHLLDAGWSAAAAAREVRRQPATITGPATGPEPGAPAAALTAALNRALDRFDAAATDQVLDDAFARLEVAAAIDEVLVPALRWVGDGWQDDPRVVAREHFATNALRPRLLRLLRLPAPLEGRTAVAAAPEHEEHDLGLLAAAAVLAAAGWRVHFLGARTPSAALERAVADLRPRVVLVAAIVAEHARAYLSAPPEVGRALTVLGGAGFETTGTGDRPATVLHRGPYRRLPEAVERGLAARRRTG